MFRPPGTSFDAAVPSGAVFRTAGLSDVHYIPE